MGLTGNFLQFRTSGASLLSGVLFLCLTYSLASDELPSDYCRDMPLGGYKRHPNDCSRYVSCWSMTNFYVQSCQNGLLYDESSSVCNYAALVDCGRSPSPYSTPAPTFSVTRLRTLFTTRRRTLRPQVITRRTQAPSRISVFNTITRRPKVDKAMVHAVHDEDLSKFVRAMIRPSVKKPVVPSCERDGLYPDGANCTRYYICSFGTPYTFYCPLGTYFSAKLSRCDFLSSFKGADPCAGQGQTQQRPVSIRPVVATDNRRTTINQQATRGSTRGRDNNAISSGRGRGSGRANGRGNGRDRENREEETNQVHQPGDMLGMIADFFETGKEMARGQVKNAVKMESMMAGRTRVGQSAFHGVANFLGSNSVVKKMSLAAEQQLNTLKIIKEKFDLSKDEVKMVMQKIHSTLEPNPSMVIPDSPRDRIKMDLNTCPYPDEERQSSQCDPNSPYRTMDGTCNNLRHPLWGRAMTPLTRFLDPDYCDNIGCPRRSRRNNTLPSGRMVSWKLFDNKADTSHVHTFMLMTAGQLLDHDLTKTALTMISADAEGRNTRGGGELSEVSCGSDGCSTKGEENRGCMPIEIPPGDNAFGSMKCLMFVRTQEVPQLDCQLGPRQQLNQLTHYMDASNFYGSSKEESDALRTTDRSRGFLKHSDNKNPKYKALLPQGDNKDCRDTNSTIRCFKAGDERVNENVALTGLHIVFMRIHNLVEAGLHKVNPSWGGDRLFHETRKIIGALWQHIIYNEYLPIILGPQAMARYGLTLRRNGHNSVYDPSVSVEIANVFATAAFRFSHSMISDVMTFGNQGYKDIEEKPLSMLLRRPYEVYNNGRPAGSGVDSIMHGMMGQKAMRIDRHFTKEVTEHLFAENPPHGPGTDLAAINIQRGRDHGLPGYNAWRRWCNLPAARSFNNLPDIEDPEAKRILSELYDDVEDIDIFPGAISERNIPGGIVGPTFACILGRQFRNLKTGDRFWYERRDANVGFTLAQLNEIRKITLSKLICSSCDNIEKVQKYVMLRPISDAFKDLGGQRYAEVYSIASLYHGEQNERKPCEQLPDLDLSKWKE